MRLFYQPKIDMASGRVIGAEALIRWQHPDDGLLPPGRFLPLIDGNALQTTLDWWVLNRAIAQISAWRDTLHDFVVSVNISPRQSRTKISHNELPIFYKNMRLTAALLNWR